MHVKVKHLHLVCKKLASGRFNCYAYAWRSGPQISQHEAATKPAAKDAAQKYLGTPEGVAKLASALEAHDILTKTTAPNLKFIEGLSVAYLSSPEFATLKPRTRSDYAKIIADFREEFGSWRVALFEDPRIAQDMSEWRDAHPSARRGDMRMSIVGALFSWARSRGLTNARPTEPVRKIYAANRADKIWQEEDLKQILAAANPSLARAIRLAVNTGLRQGDLIALPWSAANEVCIRVTTSKRGREAVIPITDDLRATLADIPKRGPVMLTSERGTPWTASGLRSTFDKTKKRAGFTTKEDLRWHDFRGTAVTRLRKTGLTTRDLAQIFAWSETKIEAILNRYVSAEALVEDMLSRMSGEQNCKPSVNRATGAADNDS